MPGADLDGGSLEAAVDDLQLWDMGEVVVDTTEILQVQVMPFLNCLPW